MGSKIKRWVPLVAVLYTAVLVILQAWGFSDAATQLQTIGGFVSLGDQSPVSGAELAAAAAMFSGVVLKVMSQIGKAKNGERQ